MKVKNISSVERHVEKIVLAVAAAGAVYLGYAAYTSPITVKDGNTDIPAGGVEKAVERAIDRLHAKQAEANGVSRPSPTKPTIPTEGSGVPDILVAKFAPDQLPIGAFDNKGNENTAVRTVPTVPAPTDPKIGESRGIVILNAQPAGVAPNPAWVPITKDMSWVWVSATYDMTALQDSIAGKGLPPEQVLPASAQQTYIVRVEAQKRLKTGEGGFGPWQPVDPLPNQVGPWAGQPSWDIDLNALPSDPKALPDYLKKVEANVNDIIHPPFLPVQGGGPVAPPPPVAPVPVPPRVVPGGLPGAIPPGAPGARPVVPVPVPPPVVAPVAPAPVAGAGGPAIGAPTPMPVLIQNPAAQIVFYDPNVESDRDVQYRFRIKIYNPVFKFNPKLKLNDNAARNEAYLNSDWVEVPAGGLAFHTQANQFFWLTAGVGGGVDARVFKWAGGHWVDTEDPIAPGSPVGQPKTVPGFIKGLDFTTGYVVVDVLPDTPRGDTSVLLLNTASGMFVTRTLNTDANDPQRLEFERRIRPAMAPVPATPGGTPTVP